MKKRFLAIVLVTVSLSTMLVGCGEKKEPLEQQVLEVYDSGINQGRNGLYIELAYEMLPGRITEEEYNSYIAAKEQYGNEKTNENLQSWVDITQQILKKIL